MQRTACGALQRPACGGLKRTACGALQRTIYLHRLLLCCSIATCIHLLTSRWTSVFHTSHGCNAEANVASMTRISTCAAPQVVPDNQADPSFRHGHDRHDPCTRTGPSCCRVKRVRTTKVACDPDGEWGIYLECRTGVLLKICTAKHQLFYTMSNCRQLLVERRYVNKSKYLSLEKF